MIGLDWIDVDSTQLLTVCICILVLEGVQLHLQYLGNILQRVFGGGNYRRMVEIKRKKRDLEIEKKNYHIVDQFPKIAKLDRLLVCSDIR